MFEDETGVQDGYEEDEELLDHKEEHL